jgi:carboxylesterase
MVEPYYGRIKIPVCIVQGEKDPIVPFATADHLYKKLGSSRKKLITSPSGKHHICYSDDCNDWFEEVLQFMQDDLEI